jgi:hypothetical protein
MRWGAPAPIVCLSLLSACGGGGGGGGGGDADWLFPLWVPTDVAVVDVDGNGRQDILTLAQYSASQYQREGRLIVHLQSAPGAFTAVQTAVVGVYPWRLAIADIDGDSAIDVAVIDAEGSRGVWVLLQDAANRGRFLAPREVASGIHSYGLAAGDFNGDAAPDLAVADSSPGSGRVAILYQDPGRRGSFGPAVALSVLGSATTDVAAGDIDGDRRPDAAVAGFFPVGSPSTVQARLNRFTQSGAGGFALVTGSDLTVDASRITAGDVDGDGRNELVVLGAGDRYLVVR